MADEISFLLRRAEQESIEAIRSIHPVASNRHQQMAVSYSERARALLVEPVQSSRRG
ncbi:MAG: hypothetical protein ABIO69_07600 [Sphingomicrobium sp.]